MSADIIPLPRSRPTLDPMLSLTAAGMNSVNAVILARMQSEIPLIPRLAGHLISGGGKRLRPMLTLAGADLVGYNGTRHHKLAAAVEFIHTATLLHDDVVDGSELRRGKAAANIIFGNPATVLVGDFLFSRAFELMTEDGSLRVLSILSRASAVIAEGEVSQLSAQRQMTRSPPTFTRRSRAPLRVHSLRLRPRLESSGHPSLAFMRSRAWSSTWSRHLPAEAEPPLGAMSSTASPSPATRPPCRVRSRASLFRAPVLSLSTQVTTRSSCPYAPSLLRSSLSGAASVTAPQLPVPLLP
jgi:hypothetical protein